MIERRVSIKDGVLMPLSSEFVDHGMNSCMAGCTQGHKVADGVVWRSGLLSKAVYVMDNIRRMFPAFLAGMLITLQDNLSRAAHPSIAVRRFSPFLDLFRVGFMIRPSSNSSSQSDTCRTFLLNTMLENKQASTLGTRHFGTYLNNPSRPSESIKAGGIVGFVRDWFASLAIALSTAGWSEVITTNLARFWDKAYSSGALLFHRAKTAAFSVTGTFFKGNFAIQANSLTVGFHGFNPKLNSSQYITFRSGHGLVC